MDDIRERFYVGMYSRIVREANSVRMDEESEFIVMRSRIFIDQADFVIEKCKNATTPLHRGLLVLANAKKLKTSTEKAAIVPKDEENQSIYFNLCKSTVLLEANMPGEALSCVITIDHPEAAAIRVHSYIGLFRIDLAEKELPRVTNEVLRTLCTAYVSLYKGNESVKSSLFALQDLSERFEMTPLLSNTISCCHFALGEWETAQMTLQNAVEKFPNDESIRINNAVATLRTNDYEKIQSQISLVTSTKNHYTDYIDQLLKDFDDTAQRLSKE